MKRNIALSLCFILLTITLEQPSNPTNDIISSNKTDEGLNNTTVDILIQVMQFL